MFASIVFMELLQVTDILVVNVMEGIMKTKDLFMTIENIQLIDTKGDTRIWYRL